MMFPRIDVKDVIIFTDWHGEQRSYIVIRRVKGKKVTYGLMSENYTCSEFMSSIDKLVKSVAYSDKCQSFIIVKAKKDMKPW